MFWDSGCFNAGKCRVLLRGELASPVMREVHDGLVQCSCHRFLFKAGSLWWSGRAGIGGLVLAAVVFVPSFASPAMVISVLIGLLGYVSFGCLSFGFFPVSVGEVLGKASSSWWLGELLSLIVERLCSSDKCGLGAEVEGTGWRAIGSNVASVWVLAAASYGLLVLELFRFAASLCMNTDLSPLTSSRNGFSKWN
ncbi:hypothetical protein YC2023_042309 [Brassica napus]